MLPRPQLDLSVAPDIYRPLHSRSMLLYMAMATAISPVNMHFDLIIYIRRTSLSTKWLNYFFPLLKSGWRI